MSSDDHENDHDADGLGLAGQIARAYRGQPRRRKTSARKKSQAAPQERRQTDEPTPVSELMNRLIDDNGWAGELSVYRVLQGWSKLVGPDIAAKTEVLGYDQGVVVVQAESTAWATQLELLAPTIVAKLNSALGDGSVIRIDVRRPHAPSWKKGPRSAPGRGPRDTYG